MIRRSRDSQPRDEQEVPIEVMGALRFKDVRVVVPDSPNTIFLKTDFIEEEQREPGPQVGIVSNLMIRDRLQQVAQIFGCVDSNPELLRFDLNRRTDDGREGIVVQQVPRNS
jgi:hypothetical protein